MRLFLDTCVVVSFFVESEDAHDDAVKLLTKILSSSKNEAFLDAAQITDIEYILRRRSSSSTVNKELVNDAVASLFTTPQLKVCDTKAIIARRAVQMCDSDFEDTVRILTAIDAGCDAIVTSNLKHFQDAPIKVLSIKQALSEIS